MMMKRMLILLFAAALLLLTAAQAEEDLYDLINGAMYRIVLRTEKEDISLGSGVLFLEQQVLLTTSAVKAEGTLYAIGTDGEHAVTSVELAGDSGVALLGLATPSTRTPLQLTDSSTSAMACIFGMNPAGEACMAPLTQIRNGMYRGQEALVVSAAENLLPGGFITDEKGALVGLAMAQQAEGDGVYFALDANAIYRALTHQQYSEAFLPVETDWTDGMLTISWTDEERSSGLYMVTVCGEENEYYTDFQASFETNTLQVTLPPAHRYYVQVQWVETADSALDPFWGSMTEAIIPAATFTDYGYTQSCILVSRPAGTKDPVTELTAPTLSAMTDTAISRYLEVVSSYDIDVALELPMTAEIIAPDGQFYYLSAICTFDPEDEARDVFLIPLDDLLADCAEFSGGTLLTGAYEVRYAIAGRTAGTLSFTLQEDGAEAVSGLATGLSAEYKDGLITLSWSDEDIPEGATVDAFYLYDGNTYYTYHRMDPGETQTEIFAVPGRMVTAWVTWTLDDTVPPLTPQTKGDYVVIPAAEKAPFTLNGFENQRLSLVPSADPDAAEKGEYLTPVPLTRAIMADRSTPLYFQTEDTYQVTELSEDHPLVIVLFTPDGMCFVDISYYIFDPTLQTCDMWLKDLSQLFEDYESMVVIGAWPAGDYRLLYCIDGQTAGEITFTLE